MATVEFWFDFACPYAYLASKQISALVARHHASLSYQPMLLGGLFKTIGAGAGPLPTLGPAKAAHLANDLARWAAAHHIPLSVPAAHPRRTVLALRCVLALPTPYAPLAVAAIYDAYWRDGIDIAAPAALAATLVTAGIPDELAQAALAAAELPAIKAKLVDQTAKAAALGFFGAPVLRIVDDNAHAARANSNAAPPLWFWGQDRLAWVDAALGGWRPDEDMRQPRPQPALPPAPPAPSSTQAAPNCAAPTVEVYFDVASPYACLALGQLRDLAGRIGAHIALKPILLGALFRNIGQVDVPLFAFPRAKQQYVGQELTRWANWLGERFQFPAKFPQRTVAAQRLIVAALCDETVDTDRALSLAIALGRAMWADNQDLQAPTTLAAAVAQAGAPMALLDAIDTPSVKQGLIDNTTLAANVGAFGVPTFVLRRGNRHQLFWGQDRLPLVELALQQSDLP